MHVCYINLYVISGVCAVYILKIGEMVLHISLSVPGLLPFGPRSVKALLKKYKEI